ncbi:MAG: hypothetical protein CML58_02275 [Rhodobacteraceae bacterium]|nr:hypothetical protein [Paracoccaceae bacterium]RZO37828.1 MAG: YeeE/YedE family protein [Paracoccaceae bacterium]|tara:strand:+ start:2001 stop:2426 length:426 start_codon:yes stop_codon:yes gene_type:complete
MNPDWISGLAGGLMIGVAASAFLLMNGRIMGASGILGGLIDLTGQANARERIIFLLGLVISPVLLIQFTGVKDTHLTSNISLIISGALLVGIGTRLANGCTSGHGVCGISRLSLRGIMATIFYLLSGVISIIVFKTMLGVI